MGTSNTERSRLYRERRKSGEIRERSIFVVVPDETYDLLVTLVHASGPFATMKSTLTQLIEKERK